MELNTADAVFKKKKIIKRSHNARVAIADDDDDISETVQLESVKERQKLRQRPRGVNVIALALGKNLPLEDELSMKDALNMKTGGLVNMQSLHATRTKMTEDDYDVDIGTQFSAETNKRDEDEEMMKYIEHELEKRKGLEAENKDEEVSKYMTPEDAALFALPEHLRKSASYRSEEMLSFQMLNGIPEVDLGIDSKIKNIEATEDAKQKLIQARLNKQDLPSHFVPTNMAVNFMQHNRFAIDDNSRDRRKRPHNNNNNCDNNNSKNYAMPPPESTTAGTTMKAPSSNSNIEKLDTQSQQQGAPPLQQQQQQHQQNYRAMNNRRPHQQQNNHYRNQVGPNGVKRATDDYHYDKFKKQFRRY